MLAPRAGQVRRATNALNDEIARLKEMLLQAGIDPDTGEKVKQPKKPKGGKA